MISEKKRLAGIRKRFEKQEPLNLSAVETEAPSLLEGLFDPRNFRGWRESIEEAGIAIEAIRIEPLTEVTCRECGLVRERLWSHLKQAHGMDVADYREAHPTAETSSEANRARMMANRHGRPAKTVIPHWEPAWSQRYALDRIHEFSRRGLPLNYGHLAKVEPGFAAYVRRVFGSWDAGLAAAGLEVDKVRRAMEAVSFSAEEVIETLREKERDIPGKLHMRASRSGAGKTVITAAFRHFGSYEKALAAAGIEPSSKIPALTDKAKTRAREKLIRETERRLKERPPYHPAEVKEFIDRHARAIKDFYGSWLNFAASLGRLEREIFNSPGHLVYDSKEACVTALQERAKLGLSLRQHEVRTDNPSLEIMEEKHFGSHAEALKAARLERLPRNFDQRVYANGNEVIAAIRSRHGNGESLYHSDLEKEARSLLKWSIRYFGSLPKALTAAGLPHPGIKPANRSPKESSRLRRK